MSAPEPRRGDRSEPERKGGKVLPAVVGVLAGILTFLAVVLGIVVLTGDGDDDPDDLVGTPVETSATPTATDTASPTASPTPTGTPTPTPTETEEGDREPTDADAARFSSTYQPPGGEDVESVTVDMNDDERPEVVVVSRANEVVRLDIAAWSGRAYEVVFTDQGGPADEIVEFIVRDVNDTGTREVVTRQRSGADGESLSIWGWDGEAFARQPARGGCWDGSHTYGIIGAELDDGEIRATCDDAPLPSSAWRTHIYVWDDRVDAWTFDQEEAP